MLSSRYTSIRTSGELSRRPEGGGDAPETHEPWQDAPGLGACHPSQFQSLQDSRTPSGSKALGIYNCKAPCAAPLQGARDEEGISAPSTVTTCMPSTAYRGHKQALIDRCSSFPCSQLETMTVQAPQPPSPHPSLVPVRPSPAEVPTTSGNITHCRPVMWV